MTPSNQVEMPAADFFAALDAMTAPKLPTYKVTLNFRKCAAWSQEVKARNAVAAIEIVRRLAAQCGFSGAERKPTVYAVQA